MACFATPDRLRCSTQCCNCPDNQNNCRPSPSCRKMGAAKGSGILPAALIPDAREQESRHPPLPESCGHSAALQWLPERRQAPFPNSKPEPVMQQPVVAAPTFAIHEPAVAVFLMDDHVSAMNPSSGAFPAPVPMPARLASPRTAQPCTATIGLAAARLRLW
jgi:hypothetical protein